MQRLDSAFAVSFPRWEFADRLRNGFPPCGDDDGVRFPAIKERSQHAIKLKTSLARLAQLLQPSLVFCFDSVQSTVVGCKLKQNANNGCNSCATVVQVLQDLFYVLLHVLFYL